MEKGCRLCGNKEAFLITLTDDQQHLILINFIASNLNVRLSAGTSCTVCGKCIGGLESWRELKRSVQSYQSLGPRHHSDEPPSVSNDLDPPSSVPRYFYNSPHEEFNPAIQLTMSLAASADPLSVTGIKSEPIDYHHNTGSTSSLAEDFAHTSSPSVTSGRIYESTSGSQIDIVEHTIKQEPSESSYPQLSPRSGVNSANAGRRSEFAQNSNLDTSDSVLQSTSRTGSSDSRIESSSLVLSSRDDDSRNCNQTPLNCESSSVTPQNGCNTPGEVDDCELTADESGNNVGTGGQTTRDNAQKQLDTRLENGFPASQRDKNNKNIDVECKKCALVVSTRDEMVAHLLKKHGIDVVKCRRRRLKEVLYYFVCTLCGQKFEKYNPARSHRKVHSGSVDVNSVGDENEPELESEEEEETDASEVDERLRHLDEVLLKELKKVEKSIVDKSGENGDEKSGESEVAKDGDSGGDAKVRKSDSDEEIDDKTRVALEIFRNELFAEHFQHVKNPLHRRGDGENNNIIPHDRGGGGPLGGNVKVETLEALVRRRRGKVDDKTEIRIVRECLNSGCATRCDEGKENLKAAIEALEDSKAQLSVIVKTENIYNDAVEENSEYNVDRQVANQTNHFLALASSENSPSSATKSSQNSLGDDQLALKASSLKDDCQVKDNFQCNLCNVYFDSIAQLGEHMKSHTFEIMRSNYLKGLKTQTEIKCFLCSTVVNAVRFKKHLNHVHASVEFPIPEPIILSNGVKCRICKENFKRTAMYESHTKPCFIESMVMKQLRVAAQLMNDPDQKSRGILDIEMKQPCLQSGDYKKDFKKPLNGYAMKESLPVGKKAPHDRKRKQPDGESLSDTEKSCSSQSKSKRVKSSRAHVCEKCGLDCGTKLKFDIHRIFHGAPQCGGSFTCEECGVTWSSSVGARKHLKRKHLKIAFHVRLCAHCLQEFQTGAEYKSHYASQVRSLETGDETESEEDSDLSDATSVDVEEVSNEGEDVREKQSGTRKNVKQSPRIEPGQAIETETSSNKSKVPEKEFSKEDSTKSKQYMLKELKRLNINANFTPADGSVEKRHQKWNSKFGRESHSKALNLLGSRSSRELNRRDLGDGRESTRSSSAESGSSSRTTRSNRSTTLTPREQSPDVRRDVVKESKDRNAGTVDNVKGNKKNAKADARESPVLNVERSDKTANEKGKAAERLEEVNPNEKSCNKVPDAYIHDHKGHKREIYSCKYCLKNFITNVVYEEHVMQCKKGTYRPNKTHGVCSLCNIFFTDIKRHMMVHGNTNHRFQTQKKYIYVYQCPICNMDTKQDISKFNRHVEECKIKGSKMLKCKFCKRNCSTLCNKLRHQAVCNATAAKDMFRKSKIPLLKCTWCCRHLQLSKQNHDLTCKEPVSTKVNKSEDVRKSSKKSPEKVDNASETTEKSPMVKKTKEVVSSKQNTETANVSTLSTQGEETVNKCEKCLKTFPLRIAYKKHIIKCDKQTKTGEEKESDKQVEKEEEKVTSDEPSACLSCFICGTVIPTQALLFLHYTRTHQVKIEKEIQDGIKQYKCIFCKKWCKGMVKFNLHAHYHKKMKHQNKSNEERNKTETSETSKLNTTPSLKTTPHSTKKSKDRLHKEKPSESHTKPTASEFIITTRHGTHVRPNVEVQTPTSSRNQLVSPHTSREKLKPISADAQIMNSYKNKKKRTTKCEICKGMIVNHLYTRHAVQCIRNNVKNAKLTENAKIMSGYIKKKKKPPKMLCIHCKLHISSHKFATHSLKCERKNSYRKDQTSSGGDEKEKTAPIVANTIVPRKTQTLLAPIAKPQVTIPKASSQVKTTPPKSNSSKPTTSPIIKKTGISVIEVINLEPDPQDKTSKSISKRLPEISIVRTEAKTVAKPNSVHSPGVSLPKSSTKKIEVTPPVMSPIRKDQPPSPRIRKDRPRLERIAVREPNKVWCPLCSTSTPLHKASISSHYNFYHKRELSRPMYLEVLGLKPETNTLVDPNAIFCPLCEKLFLKDGMKAHYLFHKRDVNYQMFIEVLGFCSESDFIDFIENKHKMRQTRSSGPEIIDLDDTSSHAAQPVTRKPQVVVKVQPPTTAKPNISFRKSQDAPAEPESSKPLKEKRTYKKRNRIVIDGEVLDEDVSLANILEGKRSRRATAKVNYAEEDQEEEEEVVETPEPKRQKRSKNVLETSDPIILNENDADDLSEHYLPEDDPLADPFGGCADSGEKVAPCRPYVMDDESTSAPIEDEIAVLGDWESLEKKTTEPVGCVSNKEIEEKRQLERVIKEQVQARVNAVFQKNLALAEAKKKAALAEKSDLAKSVTKPTPNQVVSQKKPNSMSSLVLKSPAPSRLEPKNVSASNDRGNQVTPNTVKQKKLEQKSPSPVTILKPILKSSNVSISPGFKDTQSSSNSKISSKKPTDSKSSTAIVSSSKTSIALNKPSTHRVEKILLKPSETLHKSHAKSEKIKKKLLLNFKKETSKNSYSVSHKAKQGSSRPDIYPTTKKIILHRPKNKDLDINQISSKQSDKNIISKLREVKIQRKVSENSTIIDDKFPLDKTSVLSSKIQSISKDLQTSNPITGTVKNSVNDEGLKSTANKSVNDESSNSSAKSKTSGQLPNDSTPATMGAKNSQELETPIVLESVGVSSNEQKPAGVTFSETFVKADSPPPDKKLTSFSSEPTPAPDTSGLLEAPGSPLFPPPPSHLQSTSQPVVSPTPSPTLVSREPVALAPKSPDSPPMFPTLSRTVGISDASLPTPTTTTSEQSSQRTPQSTTYSNVQPTPPVQSPAQHSYVPPQSPQQSQTSMQYSSTHGSPYVEITKPPVSTSSHPISTSSYVDFSRPTYVEYPKPNASVTFSQRYNTLQAMDQSSPPSPMYPGAASSTGRSHTPALSPAASYENPNTPSSPMMRPASRTPGVAPSPSSYSDPCSPHGVNSPSAQPYPNTAQSHAQPQQQIKLPPVSTIVPSFRNTNSPYPFSNTPPCQEVTRPANQTTPDPSKSYTNLSTPSPSGQYNSPSPASPYNSSLTDNLLSLPTMRRSTDARFNSSPLPPLTPTANDPPPTTYSSPGIPTPISSSISPNYSHLSTAYPISSAYTPPVSSVTTTPKPRKKTASGSTSTTYSPTSVPPRVTASTPTYPSYDGASVSNLISYPVAGDNYSYASPHGMYASHTGYSQSPPSYLSYPAPTESHIQSDTQSQSFRPYESPYHASPPMLYDYGAPGSYAGNYALPPHHAGYPPNGGQYNLSQPPAPSSSQYYNHPPDPY